MALTDNILAVYKLDETSGTTITDALGNYNGTVGGATINQTGAATNTNKSYYFNNLTTSNKATLPSNTVFDFGTNNFTISFWIKGNFDSANGTAFLGSTAPFGTNSTSIKWDWSGAGFGEKLTFSQYNGSTTLNLASNALSANTWYFFTISRNGDTLSMYKNGSLENSSTGWSARNCNFTKATYQPTLGWWAADATDYIQVYLDELYFWSGKALSLAEHQSLYNSGAGLQYPFLTTYTSTITSKARVKRSEILKTITAKARTKISGIVRSETSKARISISGRAYSITAKTKIEKGGVKEISAKADIMNTSSRTISSRGDIKITGVNNSITSKSRISTLKARSITAKANLKCGCSEEIQSKANIKSIDLRKTVSSKAAIKLSKDKTILAKANIKKTGIKSLTGRARIWAFPAGYVTMDRRQPKILNDHRKI